MVHQSSKVNAFQGVASGSSSSKANAASQSSSTPAATDLGSAHQTPPPTTATQTNVNVSQPEGQETNGDDEVIILGEDPNPNCKRSKRCTSVVWKYFDKETIEVEVDGQKYKQLWGRCKFPHCRKEYRAESGKGTTGFWNHLKAAHSLVKGQKKLSVAKDHTKNTVVIQPYRYDSEVSLSYIWQLSCMNIPLT